ncbi:PTS sugar transporter subunit IIA [Lacticaseibacillus daqingensis]|uniref:PTS sugar transporter subunit IIA n=1 Tax=Lacticaseibacillus daqingensis TaxID=2486014 RepID=UPI0013DDFF3B|nr:PTS sugar transporter subunit IIA [Lacticaseibacillus daqingensis]
MNFIIATHGAFASGLLSATEVILGHQERVRAIDMYVDEEPLDQKINRAIQEFQDKDADLVILTDMFGGSVNQKLMKLIDMSKVKVLTGINLPMLLEILTVNNDELDADRLNQIISQGREQMMFVNEYLVNADLEDDF